MTPHEELDELLSSLAYLIKEEVESNWQSLDAERAAVRAKIHALFDKNAQAQAENAGPSEQIGWLLLKARFWDQWSPEECKAIALEIHRLDALAKGCGRAHP